MPSQQLRQPTWWVSGVEVGGGAVHAVESGSGGKHPVADVGREQQRPVSNSPRIQPRCQQSPNIIPVSNWPSTEGAPTVASAPILGFTRSLSTPGSTLHLRELRPWPPLRSSGVTGRLMSLCTFALWVVGMVTVVSPDWWWAGSGRRGGAVCAGGSNCRRAARQSCSGQAVSLAAQLCEGLAWCSQRT